MTEEILRREEPDRVKKEIDMAVLRGSTEAATILTMMMVIDKSDERFSAGRIAEGAFYANNALLAKTLKFWIWDVTITKQYALSSMMEETKD